MENFHKIIGYLLEQEGSVGLPGLGKLFLTRKPAQLDKVNGIIHPPFHSIEFTEELSAYDNIQLPNKYAADTQSTLSESNTIIRNAITSITNKIAEEGQYALPGLGVIQKDRYNKYSFMTDNVLGIHTEYTALQSISIANVAPSTIHSETDKSPKYSLDPVMSPSAQPEPSIMPSAAASAIIEAKTEPEKMVSSVQSAESKIETNINIPKTNSLRTILWIIGLLLLTALAIQILIAPDVLKRMFSNKEITSNTGEENNTNQEANTTIESNHDVSNIQISDTSQNTVADTASLSIATTNTSQNIGNAAMATEIKTEEPQSEPNTTSSAVAESINSSSSAKNDKVLSKKEQKPAISDNSNKADTDGYCIILGTFSVKKNAERLQKTIKSQGYNAIILPFGENKNKVCIYFSGGIENANRELSKFTSEYPDAIVTRR